MWLRVQPVRLHYTAARDFPTVPCRRIRRHGTDRSMRLRVGRLFSRLPTVLLQQERANVDLGVVIGHILHIEARCFSGRRHPCHSRHAQPRRLCSLTAAVLARKITVVGQ